ncbi:helix-turn-helix domain-containing protein [Nocardia amikacinitolerans]|uniref:helix-turn-helix domain-containing protein n=1 Tax=Nocardia amikacinitolerans TaxID=756689 RepID=UPI0020A5FA95|nr:helix-turn-helix transcriptional regulator [Nocardia amikacinitolerans]MCP2280939.1 Helix-turn-helix domain-containing protein [Nocardia amikacinitolerans]
MNRSAISEFLQSRRARIRPQDIGIRDGIGRRRVPGLRREDVALLAGTSVDYYIRLEQGRCANVSDAVLDAVAGALRLDPDEREHLFRIARPRRTLAGARPLPAPELWRLLDWIAAPALVADHRLDVLAWNRAMSRLVAEDHGTAAPTPNLARMQLVDVGMRERYPDRRANAAVLVAHLRVAAGEFADDQQLTALIDELRACSADFRREWDAYPVGVSAHGAVTVVHPTLGALDFIYEVVSATPDRQRSLWVYTAAAGTREEQALRELAAG